jgi:AcrR family transcriptional regulator
MSDPVKPAEAAPRGRPRNLGSRAAILRAARELLAEGGPAAVTMEAVAARAGVGKPTVYRWWPNRHAVAMAALMDQSSATRSPARASHSSQAPARARPPLRALEQQLLQVVETLGSRQGRLVTAMIAAADPDTEVAKAFRHHFVLARRQEGRVLLEQALAAGDLRADISIDVALDQVYGALFFRIMLGHAGVDAAFVKALLRQALRGWAVP